MPMLVPKAAGGGSITFILCTCHPQSERASTFALGLASEQQVLRGTLITTAIWCVDA